MFVLLVNALILTVIYNTKTGEESRAEEDGYVCVCGSQFHTDDPTQMIG